MTVELRHLRCFLAIAEEGNVTRAAARLGLSQPALSRALRALEEHFGVLLVDRSTHHLELTAAGCAFRPRAAAALAAVDDALDAARLGTWPLRLGHAWSALGDFTTPLLRRWRQEHPDVPLELLRIDDRTAGLADGRVDVALLRGQAGRRGIAGAAGSAGLHSETLLTEDRFAAVPEDSAPARRDRLTLADLADLPIALNTVSGSTTLNLWPAGARPVSTVAVANTDDWLAAIAAGRAAGVTSSATVAMHPHPGVVYLPLTDAPPVEVRIAWPEPPTHPATRILARLTHEVVTG